MNVILGLILASLLVAGGGLVAFLWSLKNGQYEDLKGASQRILFDDAPERSALVRSAAPTPVLGSPESATSATRPAR